MAVIVLTTRIKSPAERVFDLSRSVDFHILSTKHTGEIVVDGPESGFLNLHDTITWRARHLGFRQNLTVRIVESNRPYSFTDTMIRGAFKHMLHRHLFEQHTDYTLMRDEFEFSSPAGIIGKLFDQIYLKGYLKRLLVKRNAMLKTTLESGAWQQYPGMK